MSYRAARVDSNQRAIVDALRDHGCSVQSLAALGNGVPDLLVGFADLNWIFEVKNPLQPPSKQRLTADEQRWLDAWRGQAKVIRTPYEALLALKVTP